MRDNGANHRQAAVRHEQAADNHDRAAGFWDAQRDPKRAALQREMATHERAGAELEIRWADLSDQDAGRADAAELVVQLTRQGARRASELLAQLADSLERSARLADEHAQKREHAGRGHEAVDVRDAAQGAREVAQQARSQADAWLKLLEERERRS